MFGPSVPFLSAVVYKSDNALSFMGKAATTFRIGGLGLVYADFRNRNRLAGFVSWYNWFHL